MTLAINPQSGRGRGRIDGDDWLIEFNPNWKGTRSEGEASINDPSDYAVGDQLRVVAVESNVLIVEPLN